MIRKIIGSLGDVDPISHGGGYVFSEDDRTWIEYLHPSECGKEEGLTLYLVHVEDDILDDFGWVKVVDLEDHVDSSYKLQVMSTSVDVLERAALLEMIGSCYGWVNLDEYPQSLSKEQLEKRWAE